MDEQINRSKTNQTKPNHLERMGKRKGATGFRWADLRKRDSLEHLYVDRRTQLKWLFKKWEGERRMD
jgi:hypothetical protein